MVTCKKEGGVKRTYTIIFALWIPPGEKDDPKFLFGCFGTLPTRQNMLRDALMILSLMIEALLSKHK